MALTLTPRDGGGGAFGVLPDPLRLTSGSAVIGRADGADLLLPHPLVSSRHCVVSGQAGAWRLEDTSTNGTQVNGRRVTGPQTLRNGDVIGIADLEVAVAIDVATAPWPSRASLDDWGRSDGSVAAAPTVRPQAAEPVARMMQAAGLAGGGADLQEAAGAALLAAITGLTELAKTRAKARRDLKLPDPAGQANPILAGDTAALAKLMTMPAAAVADAVTTACKELEAHQRAGFGAMQAAFKAALDHFAPGSITLRARDDASAWKLYEKAFAADDGFVETFAAEFAKAYARLSQP